MRHETLTVLGFTLATSRPQDLDPWPGSTHDSAAAIMRDGVVLAAIEEERVNRIKHTNCFPRSAIQFCLKSAGLSWDDIDLVVANSGESAINLSAAGQALFDGESPILPDAVSIVSSLFCKHLQVDISSKLHFCGHHEAHAWSAYSLSGMSDALVLSIDGMGDGISGMVCTATRTDGLSILKEFRGDQSLGHLFARLIRLIGYTRFDEYKAMGLAPYGNPDRFLSTLRGGVRLLPEGDYSLDSDREWVNRLSSAGLCHDARRRGEPFSQVHMDLAAAIQVLLEDAAFHVLRFYRERTGLGSLCLAGGVAHNCTLNGKILRSGLFERMFVQPAAHDAGTALGACCAGVMECAPQTYIEPLRNLYLGGDAGTADRILQALTPWQDMVSITKLDNAVKEAAKLIDSGAVIGWVQGKSEFGPRALGNRSIIADPRPAAQKDRINAMVKKREAFRPFAPSVIAERAAEFFDLSGGSADLSHMTYVVSVKEQWRSSLAAITHVDGTARIQTVTRDNNMRYWELLNEVAGYTGFPILLNTSFNANCEPIVESVEDAIVCYLTTGIDYLIVGDYLVERRQKHIPVDALLSCAVELPESRRLVKQVNGPAHAWYLEETKGDMRVTFPRTPVSRLAALILSCSNGKDDLSALLKGAGCVESKQVIEVAEEVVQLWTKRLIRVRPSGAIRISDY